MTNGIHIIKAQSIPTTPADSFVESIGVNTHWASSNVYNQSYTSLRTKLSESGIRYIRDGTFHAGYARINDLYYNFGIKTNMLTGRRMPGQYPTPLDSSKIDEELNEIKTRVLAAIVSLEAPNEYDLSHGPDTDWVRRIQNYSSLLYIKAKSDETLKNFPVIGPSLTTEQAYEAVGDLDQYIDYVNLHMYQLNLWPGTNGLGDEEQRSITWFLNNLARYQSPSVKHIFVC
jgi:hypothetical protein